MKNSTGSLRVQFITGLTNRLFLFRIVRYLQPTMPPVRSMGVGTTSRQDERRESMPYDFIRRIIQAAIELFPIDEAKKADMLRSIVKQKTKEEDQ